MWATWSPPRSPPADSDATGPVNIGTGRETDVLELIESLKRLSAAARASSPSSRPPRTGEVQRITIDAARAERELGWRAEMDLEEGLRVTLESI